MSRKRMIDSGIWRDKKVIRLSNDGFILWIAIISMADDEGIFEYDADSWFYEIARKGLTPAKINAAMNEIIEQGMVVMYGDGYGFIPAWYKHQNLSHPTPSKNERPPKEVLDRYPEYIESWLKTFTTYKKDENGNRIAVAPIYPYPEQNSIIPEKSGVIPENSGKLRKTPGSIDKISIDQSSIDKISIDQSNNIRAPQAAATPSSKFIPPTLEEVKAYCTERHNNVDPARFIDFYTSKGWLVGKAKMRDWRAAVRNWEKPRDGEKQPRIPEVMFDIQEG